jgi:signal transduction histidine kinase/CheY-like chemotaxis protein
MSRALRRIARVAWAPLVAACLAAACTLAVIDERRDTAADERLEDRADVVARALASIERDAERAATAIDTVEGMPGAETHLRDAIDRLVAQPSLVSAIAITDAAGTLRVANEESTAIERGIEVTRERSIPTVPGTQLVSVTRERGRDVLVFASVTTAGARVVMELALDREALANLPDGTAFTLVAGASDAPVTGVIAQTDVPLSRARTNRALELGGQPMTLAVSGTESSSVDDAWAAVALAAICAAVVVMTLQSAWRWRAERRYLAHEEKLLDGALAHQQRVEADLRVSETQLRAVLASTPDTVAVLEPLSHHVQLLNRAELLGHDASLFEESGFLLSIVVDDSELRLWWAALALAPLDEHRHIEFWARAADDSRRRLRLRVAPLRGAGLSLQHRCLGVFTDVTEGHEQHERERAMREELERARHLESLGRLAGGIAHDFRNVLAAVDMNTDLLAARADRDAARHLDVIRRATARASDMVQQLLAFAKRDLADPVLVDLNDAVAGMEPVLRCSVYPEVTLDFALDPEPCPTHAGPGQLDRLILNLVCNARDALPDGGTVRIATRRERGAFEPDDDERDWVVLIVADDGVGIPDDIIDKVFEPFFSTKGGGGSGLGLASVHGIVTALGGHVAISSTVGRGTTVTLALPLDATTPAANPPADRSPDGRRVLLVDHDAEQRAPTAQLLRERGFDVVEAGSASDGLAAMAERTPDVLVTDLVIPGAMNGLDLAARARHEHPGVSVLVVSEYADAVIADGSPISHRLVRKPLSADELAEAVDLLHSAQHRADHGDALNEIRADPASALD